MAFGETTYPGGVSQTRAQWTPGQAAGVGGGGQRAPAPVPPSQSSGEGGLPGMLDMFRQMNEAKRKEEAIMAHVQARGPYVQPGSAGGLGGMAYGNQGAMGGGGGFSRARRDAASGGGPQLYQRLGGRGGSLGGGTVVPYGVQMAERDYQDQQRWGF